MKITRKPVLVVMGHSSDNMCPTMMYAHEVCIQKVIRGNDKVQFIKDLDPDEYNMGPYDLESRDELVRLKRQYQAQRDAEGINPVDVIFPDGSRDLEDFYSDKESEVSADVLPPVAVLPPGGESTSTTPSRKDIIAELTALNIPFALTQPTQQLIIKLAEVKAGTDEDE